MPESGTFCRASQNTHYVCLIIHRISVGFIVAPRMYILYLTQTVLYLTFFPLLYCEIACRFKEF